MKQNLNGKYCLATKENYEQLVKDGCIDNWKCGWLAHEDSKYLFIVNGDIGSDENKEYITDMGFIPIHYNKEKECWVFGSLERELTLDEQIHKLICGDNLMQAYEQPKQLEHITMKQLTEKYFYQGSDGGDHYEALAEAFEYVKHLEANQKDK